MLDDTIAAIATPLGEGGLAVIRLSGPAVLAVADKSFVPAGKQSLRPSAAPTHTIHYGKIVRQGRPVDEVLLAVMRAPRTFTREDVVEITCHGGILAAKLVLDTVLESGAEDARAPDADAWSSDSAAREAFGVRPIDRRQRLSLDLRTLPAAWALLLRAHGTFRD